jgi:hypothetical protein
MNKLYEPGEILAKEVERGGILVNGRNGMDANCATAKGIVATGAATNRNASNRASADCKPTDGGPAYRKNNSDGRSSERKETDRETAKG